MLFDELCKVEKQKINSSLFQKERKNKREEKIRQLILKALETEEDEFYVIIPQKNWEYQTLSQICNYGPKIGNHIASLNEWALYIAQKISKGETWKEAQENKYNLLILGEEGPISISPRFYKMAEIGLPAVDGRNEKGWLYGYYDGYRTVPMVIFYNDSSDE